MFPKKFYEKIIKLCRQYYPPRFHKKKIQKKFKKKIQNILKNNSFFLENKKLVCLNSCSTIYVLLKPFIQILPSGKKCGI
jgi:hypothetical protein